MSIILFAPFLEVAGCAVEQGEVKAIIKMAPIAVTFKGVTTHQSEVKMTPRQIQSVLDHGHPTQGERKVLQAALESLKMAAPQL